MNGSGSAIDLTGTQPTAGQRHSALPPLWLQGVGFWAPTMPGWVVAKPALSGRGPLADPPAKRPQPQMLPPAERRRAPDTVALALEVAAAACTDAALDPATLPSVFCSAHGDLAINDNMCSTLASTPTLISPTRFHNSVHNAAAGYWTMATACHEPSTALTAWRDSMACGLLAGATQALTDGQAVLVVGYDVSAVGALASVTHSEGLLAMALVISPHAGARPLARLDLALCDGACAPPALRSPGAQALAGNAMAGALPLAEALASLDLGEAHARTLNLPAHDGQTLQLTLHPLTEPA